MPMDVTMSETQFAPAGWEEGHAANPWPALASQGRGHSSDEQLAHAAGRGDRAAFDALYQRHHQPLLAFARHMLGRMHDAEDVVQHTFLAADRAFRAGKVPRAVRAWLYTVARNRCVSVLRARRDEVALAGDERLSTDGLAAEVEQREELRALVADLRRLPDDQRAALLLAELGELTHVEVARVIGVRQGKVKALVFQAREALAAASHARSLSCRSIREELSVATGAGLRRRHLRDHLTQCEGCREFSEQVRAQRAALAVVLPVVPSVGLHEAIVGGAAAAGAAGAGAAGAGALSAGSVAAKLLTIAAVGGAAAGGGALGLTELDPGGGDRPAVARVAPPAPRSADPGAEFTAVVQTLGQGRKHGAAGPGAPGDRAAKAPRPAPCPGAEPAPGGGPGQGGAAPRDARGPHREPRPRDRARAGEDPAGPGEDAAGSGEAAAGQDAAGSDEDAAGPDEGAERQDLARPGEEPARAGRPAGASRAAGAGEAAGRARRAAGAGGAAVTRRLGARAGEEAGRGDAGDSATRRRAGRGSVAGAGPRARPHEVAGRTGRRLGPRLEHPARRPSSPRSRWTRGRQRRAAPDHRGAPPRGAPRRCVLTARRAR